MLRKPPLGITLPVADVFRPVSVLRLHHVIGHRDPDKGVVSAAHRVRAQDYHVRADGHVDHGVRVCVEQGGALPAPEPDRERTLPAEVAVGVRLLQIPGRLRGPDRGSLMFAIDVNELPPIECLVGV